MTPAGYKASAPKFVSELELASPSELGLPSLATQPMPRAEVEPSKPSAAVVGDSTVSFVAGVSKQHREDVLNSALLAQLAASKKFDSLRDTENWYKFYKTVLENVGWVVPGFSFDRFQAAGDTFTVDKVIVDVLQAAISGDELALVVTTINALKRLDQGDGRLVLYESQTHSDQKGNFQAQSVLESDGIVVMNIGAFFFSTEDSVTRILFFNFPSSRTSFFKGVQTMNLDDGIYSQVRQVIKDKLGANATNFVKDLEI